MKLLLDTNALLFWLDDPSELKEEARRVIANPRHHVFVSPVSLIEIAIKEERGKIAAPPDLESALESCRFIELRFSMTHAAAMRHLPPIHRDPFDRMLVAQAMAEKLTLVTRDALLGRYAIPILAA